MCDGKGDCGALLEGVSIVPCEIDLSDPALIYLAGLREKWRVVEFEDGNAIAADRKVLTITLVPKALPAAS